MRSAFDWISRVIMLVLAGLVSLSIIGAIASIPAGIAPIGTGADRAQRPVPEASEPIPPDAPPRPSPRRGEEVEQDFSTGGAVGPAPEAPVEPARWLEAITYALLALAGIGALGLLLLWRGLSEQRRIAEALEALARRP